MSSKIFTRWNLVDNPFECYFTEVIPAAPCPHFPSKFNWSPFRILPIFLAIRPFGFSVTTDSHLYSPKNQVIPSKILSPPPPFPPPINNDRSLSIDSSFSRLKVQVLGKNRWKHWLRYFHTFAEGVTVMSGDQRGERVPSASPLQVTRCPPSPCNISWNITSSLLFNSFDLLTYLFRTHRKPCKILSVSFINTSL